MTRRVDAEESMDNRYEGSPEERVCKATVQSLKMMRD